MDGSESAVLTPAAEGAGGAGERVLEPEQKVQVNSSVGPAGPAATPSPALSEPRVAPPRAVYAPPPEHPGLRVVVEAGPGTPYAVGLGLQGRVRIRLLVLADGRVGRVDLLVPSGQPELDRAAVEALGRWRFEPARRGGEPVDSYYLVWVVFETR